MARLALALALCVGVTNGLGTTLPECEEVIPPLLANFGCGGADDGAACSISGVPLAGVCAEQGLLRVCSCCVGGEGLVPAEFDPPYLALDPGTVLPECPDLD